MADQMGTPAGSAEISKDDKLWALLGYIIPIFPIIVLVSEDKKNRPFLRYHAVVSLALAVVWFVLSFLCIGSLLWFYSIYLGVKAYQGEKTEVPVISDFCRKQGWI